MVRKYLLVALLLSIFLAANGQENKFESEWNVGVGFGPTFSSVDFETGPSISGVATKSWQQFHGGISIRYLSEKNLGLIAELNYSQQGWQQEFAENTQSVFDYLSFAHSHRLNYLELPVLTHIYFGRKVRFIFNLGPKIGFLLGESEKMNKELEDALASGKFPVSNPSYQYYHKAERKIDYGIIGGVGLELRTGIGNFTLEGRYTFGLGDIYNNSKADYFTRSANRVISARLTYYVKLF
ncbi:MAG: PorT family protein [Prevotella sp.]|jgi:hypothetical protein|nr:PorT family protein [Prevotella sp.]